MDLTICLLSLPISWKQNTNCLLPVTQVTKSLYSVHCLFKILSVVLVNPHNPRNDI